MQSGMVVGRSSLSKPRNNRIWEISYAPHLKLPVVLSAQEVRLLLSHVQPSHHRIFLTALYACGLRLGECLNLTVGEIDSTRLSLHIRHGKRNADRYVPLPARVLPLLRLHWKTHKHPKIFNAFPASVWEQRWVTDCRQVGLGEKALAHLSRYVFKTATGNRRLETLPSGKIRWTYRQSQTGAPDSVELEPFELIRRFLQHVLPAGLVRAQRLRPTEECTAAGSRSLRS